MVKAYLSTADSQESIQLDLIHMRCGLLHCFDACDIYLSKACCVPQIFIIFSSQKDSIDGTRVPFEKSQQCVQTMLPYPLFPMVKAQWWNSSCVQCKGSVDSKSAVLQSILRHYPMFISDNSGDQDHLAVRLNILKSIPYLEQAPKSTNSRHHTTQPSGRFCHHHCH